ncbi:ankyrin repeat domain-containing protein [Streptomyces sp. CC224B]|uniref:ankyrin repeat domain-containing protein n=1 Tax=Streptomyces sp. CC224B TaxID=3044571 RepID=UPI0024A86A6B|nr:ankyrin repeat domain-containing protein [Streptomyces sp. CC224B]
MGFFDDLVLPEEPADERRAVIRLGPPHEDTGRYEPPVDWYAPVLRSHLAVVGAGPYARVVMTGWSVWPRSATLHLAVFRNTRWNRSTAGRQSGLRVGLLFPDGRRVTSLDFPEQRLGQCLGPAGRLYSPVTDQPVGLIPLDPGLHDSHRSTFKTDVDLYLAELPPPDGAQLVVEWPDEDIPETHTSLDTAVLHDASARAVEVWPGIEPPDPADQPSSLVTMEVSGAPGFLARPLSGHERAELRRQEEERQRYVPRADWHRIGYEEWKDAELIRIRLRAGAPVNTYREGDEETPLHAAADRGTAEVVALLLAHGADVDAQDEEGHTPLWYAVCNGDEDSVRALIAAGADVWTPQTGPWSPGRLLLTTALAPLVARLPGAVELPAEEAAAFRAADALISAFGDQELMTEGLGICFVRGLTEDEVIERLGADPAQCPRADDEHAPFDPTDYDASWNYVGVTSVRGAPGGCVITHNGYMPSDEGVLRAISGGTAAYGIYYNPKGGTFGTLARDGDIVAHEEIGLTPFEDDPPAYWHFRFWQWKAFPHDADTLAYACAAAGLRISDGRAAVDHRTPRRWVHLPPALQR